ncbi:hypothetical protein [Streptomyces parvus]
MGERLGLYVIIVLGEGVIQIIDAASERDGGTGRSPPPASGRSGCGPRSAR